jgi:phosphoribosylpyrophosphate synthetase
MIGDARNLDAASIHHRQQDDYSGSARARAHSRDLAQHNMVVDTVVDTSRTLGKAARRQDFSEDDGVESG